MSSWARSKAGITVGCSRDPLHYCPARSLTRAQMASFLARALGIVELPASVRFAAIDAGFGHTCGLRADNAISCWGGNYFRQSDAPDGEFLAVSAGRGHSCAIRSDRTVVCWGNNEFDQTKAPDGEFLTVSAGSWLSCGVRTDGRVACWGGKETEEFGAPPASSMLWPSDINMRAHPATAASFAGVIPKWAFTTYPTAA